MFEFAQPNVLFLENIAFNGSAPGANIVRPEHYLKQFHPDYVPLETLKAKAKERGFDQWYKLFLDRADFLQNGDYPVLTAWKVMGPLTENQQKLKRNAFYWKVDPAGKQLPYIDDITVQVVENPEVLMMKVISGDLDFDFGHLTLPNYPMLKENQQKGGYRVLLWKKVMGTQLEFMPNLNHQDAAKREIFSNKKFREALSLAINKDEINELCFMGLAETRNATVANACPYFTPGIDKLFTEYNVDKANRMLDEIGLNKRDRDGFRLRPDGQPLMLTIEYPPHTEFGPWQDIVHLVGGYWNKVGVRTADKSIDRSLYEIRTQTTEIDFVLWTWGRGMHPLIDPAFVFPMRAGHFTGAPTYAMWYSTRGKSGEKPSGDILKAMDLYDKFTVTVNPQERLAVGKEIIKIAAESCWGIPTVGLAPAVEVVKETMGNVPKESLHEWVLMQFAHVNPEQFYFKK